MTEPEDPRPAPGYPAPGAQPPPAYPAPGASPSHPAAGWGQQPGHPYAAPPPGPHRGAAHKPGAVALRPLGLGDMYDAAFRVIRYNPKATVGAAVVVSSVALLIPVLVTAVLTWTVGASFDLAADDGGIGEDASASDLVGLFGSFGSLLLGAVLQSFGLLFVTAMVVHVVATAAVGRKIGLGEAWAATRGQRWRVVGLSLLLGVVPLVALLVAVLLGIVVYAAAGTGATVLVGLVLTALLVPALVWFYVRVSYLAVPILMIEWRGVFATLPRAVSLTRQHFWRTFGIALLTALIAGVAGQMLAFPVSLVGQLLALTIDPAYQLLALSVVQAVAGVLAAAFTAPFTAAVVSTQYLDLRMRKEAYDVELMQQAGLTAG